MELGVFHYSGLNRILLIENSMFQSVVILLKLQKSSVVTPRGSVLGPLLFLLYINDLAKVSKELTFFLFADDTNIYYKSSNILDILKTVKKELRKVRKWLEENRLALNIDQTNFVIFHSPQNIPNDRVIIKFGRKRSTRKLA